MSTEQNRRIDDIRPAVGLDWDESAAKQARAAFEIPDRWTILLTSSNHGLVGAYGHEFPHATSDHVKVNVVAESVASDLRAQIVEIESSAAPASADNPSQDQILALHRQLAAEKLRADQGWQRAEAKSKECIELRERMAADNPSTAGAASTLVGEIAVLGGSWISGSLDGISNVPDGNHKVYIGAAPVAQSTAGAEKGGITSEAFEEIAVSWDGCVFDGIEIGDALRRDFDRLAAPALNTSEVRDRALEEAAKLCDAKYAARVESGHPREASSAIRLAEEIRALKSAAIKAADQQGALGEKGGE